MTAPKILTCKGKVQEIYRVAVAAMQNGLCPVPPRQDGSKAPIGEWGPYQRQRPSHQRILAWYGPHTGVGLVCGKVSGNLECLEFDDAPVYQAYKELALVSGLGDLLERIEAGYLEQSPSGGIHWLYRCDEVGGSTKLARRPGPDNRVKVLIETRGEGGYVIIAPSFGRVHPSGRPYVLLRGGVESITRITTEERRALWELARSFDLMPRPKTAERGRVPAPTSGARAGDAFNQLVRWDDLLTPHGWVKVYQRDDVGYWQRPGKELGVSATTNYQDSDLLYVFSSSTIFEPERGYSKFSAYTLLEHGGDFRAAAKSLRKQGYGTARHRRNDKHHRPRPITTWEVRG